MGSIFKKQCMILPSETGQQRGQGCHFLFAEEEAVIALSIADAGYC